MINIIIIPKLLVSETASGEAVRIEELLKKNKIPYTLTTRTNQSRFQRSMYAGYGSGYASYRNMVGGVTYVYNFFVRRRDYERAKKLITE